MIADTECLIMRLEKEQFDIMCREFPEIKAELLEEANFRNRVRRVEAQTINEVRDNAKIVVQKFGQFAQGYSFDQQIQNKNIALRY